MTKCSVSSPMATCAGWWNRGHDLRTLTAGGVMHPSPVTIAHDALAVAAAELMELRRITSVLVLDAQGRLCGALNSNDLMRAKVI